MKKFFLIIFQLMKGVFLFSTFLFFLLLFFASPSKAYCFPVGADCDSTYSCCDFSNNICLPGATGGKKCQLAQIPCGREDQLACPNPNPKCAEGYSYNPTSGKCNQSCGNGQSCCAGNVCTDPSTTCQSGICLPRVVAPCGGHQEQCCTTSPVCKVSGETCQSNGRCDVSAPTCGGYHEACCTTGKQCTRPGDYCNLGGICTYSGTCGERNEFCCPVSPVCQIPGDTCNALGKCTGNGPICGGHRMVCCSGSTKCTTPGDTCNNGTCGMLSPCGGHQQPCCQTGQACTYGGDSCQVNGLCDNSGGGGSGVKPTLCTVVEKDDGIQTALGCIPTKDTNQFVAWLLKIAIGLGGGIAFLLMIFGAIKLLTSSGNPEGIKAGGETITSALMGLLFIIFSLFLLHLIGVDILKIPGFSK